ncbi:hypothetical protein B0H19DRAFT_1377593 [Mycena capillaripes]|nr:hypothetical protein B0H19DRAFT_1377593 [Mycena capillaripes]
MHQLTRYDLNGPWEAHRDFLKLTQNLVEARIVVSGNEPWPEFGEIIDLMCLRRLYVSDSRVLEMLRFPLLEEITIYMDDAPQGTLLLAHMESSLLRSRCVLQRLCLCGCLDGHTTAEVLRKFPTIVKLALIVYSMTARTEVDKLMSVLTLSESTPVGPQLRGIFLGTHLDDPADDTIYLEMLKSRWKGPHRTLTTATLLVCRGPALPPATLGAIDALCQDGLDFLFMHGLDGQLVMRRWVLAAPWH